jgi:NADH-quinone oxidoreductase subunit M
VNGSILTWIIFFPTAGAIVLALLPQRGKLIQYFALAVTLVTFGLTLHLPAHFVYGARGFQYEVNRVWIANPPIRYHLGVDGLSVWMFPLTGFLSILGVLSSWRVIDRRAKEFYFLFLLQQTAMLGVFGALDLILYYAFWEMSLVPMAILIAMFGREHGARAALKFFLYTFIPSALFLVAILVLYARTGTFDFVELQAALAAHPHLFSPAALGWIALAFVAAFAVKVPVFPLHGWLGDVFAEAPTAMAMVVAGKLGLYSMVRFHLALFPAQARAIAPLMIALAAIGILYGAIVALTQKDLKRLIAFGTISSLSFATLGVYTFAVNGLDGAVYHILNESISGAAILILLGLMYERYGTYDMSLYGGLASKMPRAATLFVITCLSLIGLPILNGFVGEFLVLSSGFVVSTGWAVAATAGVILSASYMLWMVQRVFYGPDSPMVDRGAVRDLVAREHFALWPAAVLMLVMGVAPVWWLRAIDQGIRPVANHPAAAPFHGVLATSALMGTGRAGEVR